MNDYCGWCSGTGEGCAPEAICRNCKGSGEIKHVEESDPDDENESRAEWALRDEEWSRKFNNGTWATQ